ncbi:copper-binding protein [Thiorhodococcus mannitoliphagus]|uniref:Copper-binding protein n=1 Tax=Thiorhodococcus mannitoliphagus TaxID=329406 RepID=A0A6P1DVV3_9GAMM|nr:copper-binding protein [Thiorhodococcus mannitoliphagus]NEX22477.1 copper-binding protein [Thiorhodococcus mannitoliphagus]
MPTMPRSIALATAVTLGTLGVMPVIHAETFPVAGATDTTEISGTVVIVNQEQRMLTVQTPEGRFEVLHVPEEVKRLDEIKIGNHLAITQTDFLLVDLHKGADAGSVGVTTGSEVVRDPGEKPSGMMVHSVTVTGVVQGVNKAKSTVTIKGPERTMTFKVKDPAVLDSVAPGDSVSASYIRLISGEVKFQ